MVSALLREEYLTDDLEPIGSIESPRLKRDQTSKARFNTRARHQRGKNPGAIGGAHRRRARRTYG